MPARVLLTALEYQIARDGLLAAAGLGVIALLVDVRRRPRPAACPFIAALRRAYERLGLWTVPLTLALMLALAVAGAVCLVVVTAGPDCRDCGEPTHPIATALVLAGFVLAMIFVLRYWHRPTDLAPARVVVSPARDAGRWLGRWLARAALVGGLIGAFVLDDRAITVLVVRDEAASVRAAREVLVGALPAVPIDPFTCTRVSSSFDHTLVLDASSHPLRVVLRGAGVPVTRCPAVIPPGAVAELARVDDLGPDHEPPPDAPDLHVWLTWDP